MSEIVRVNYLKSSSMSRTLARSDLEDLACRSSSFILFWIMMVFRVIFSPGRPIRSTHGIHCRNTVRTCDDDDSGKVGVTMIDVLIKHLD